MQTMQIDRSKFFDGYRAAFGSMGQLQVDGLEFLLSKLESDSFSLKQIAYILATIHHETGVKRNGVLQRFQPIKELRERATSPRRKNQDRYWLSGYYGRGYVQITWKDNYRKFGIEDEPDKALEPETAYEITSRGMREGLFTGKQLSHYINGNADYFNARKIINGLDKAGEIASIARSYESMLSEAPTEAPAVAAEVKSDASGTMPPAAATEIKASTVDWRARLTSVSIPTGLMAGIAAVTNFVKGLPPYVWIAFALITVAGMVIGFLIWRDKNQQAHERTLKLMDAGADKNKNDLRLI